MVRASSSVGQDDGEVSLAPGVDSQKPVMTTTSSFTTLIGKLEELFGMLVRHGD